MAEPDRFAKGLSRTSLLFFVFAVTAMTLAALTCWGLMAVFGRPEGSEKLSFSPAFVLSSLLLAAGSAAMSRAVRLVRMEKQQLFRRTLLLAATIGALFMGVQTYALWSIFPVRRAAEDASLGATPFVVTLATMHGLHFWIATLFVCFVAARTLTDRYDHEYYWGVTVFAWFWHALGIVWIAILAVYSIVLW